MNIYHNPRCRKSRETLAILNEKNIKVEIIEYLQHPPTEGELKEIVDKLGIPVEELIRKGEQEFKDHFKGKQFSENEWLKILVEHPKLIERPIVVDGDKAILGRPPENVNQLI